MKEIGDRLRDERMARGISLEYIRDETKISTRYLHALEDGEFHRLPGDPYIKGFIRSYARAIGLDPNPVIARYKEIRGLDDPFVDMQARPASRGRAFLSKVNQTLQWFGL